MKIKDLFKQMEKANDFAEMVGGQKWVLCISINNDYDKEFFTFKSFFSYIKKEYAKWFIPQLLEQDLMLDSKGCGNHHFECVEPMTIYNGELFHASIDLVIYQK